MRNLILVLPFVIGPGLAVAQSSAATDNAGFGLAFNGGLGVEYGPTYFGSAESSWGPTGSFSFGSARVAGYGFGGGDAAGWGATGSFRYIASRTAEEFAELTGLNGIDAAIELGGGLAYSSDDVEASAVLRRGFGGHEGYVAELSADYVMHASDTLTFRAGPRLLAGDDTYANTYFGVTAAEAAASNFTAYEATGGALSRGVELSASYEITQDWGITGTARYDELLNDAARSPISSRDDYATFSIVITRDLSFNF